MKQLIAGVDEAGRGPLAGPVVAAAAIFEKGYRNPELRDSKELTPRQREKLFDVVRREAEGWAVVAVGHERIRQLNILQSSLLAMSLALTKAARGLSAPVSLVLVDGNVPIGTDIEQRLVIDGDRLCVEISAASILAKVWRDRLMAKLDQRYPNYGFGKHMGYGTQQHCHAIATFCPCRIHRATFRGVREFLTAQDGQQLPGM